MKIHRLATILIAVLLTLWAFANVFAGADGGG